MDETVPLDEATVLSVVGANGPLSTQEVADAVGCSRRAADHRLRTLYADGKLEPIPVGAGLLWRLRSDHGDTPGHE